MPTPIRHSLLLAMLVAAAPALAAEPDWQKVGAAHGKEGAMQPGSDYCAAFPCSDLKVTLDGVAIKPGLALGGWLAFAPMGQGAMVMGDLVLTREEVNPAMRKMEEGGIEITAASAAEPQPLTLEAKIPLGPVRGRIDHLAVDVPGKRLFVAELGNDTAGIVDLEKRTVLHTIGGLREPQGVGYFVGTQTLFVANARDGSVYTFAGPNLEPAGRLDLGDDADNVRIDQPAHAAVIGYGSGALAFIDARSQQRTADIRLAAHPEGFQLEESGSRAFVNLPDARQIAIVDRAVGKVIRSIPTGNLRSNFPMALEPAGGFLVVFRSPPRLASYTAEGAMRTSVETCGDADDVFVDAKRDRIYVSCGAGFIDVFDYRNGALVRMAHMTTVTGARTSLFVPDFDRLYLAVRAQGREPAAIWEFRPTP